VGSTLSASWVGVPEAGGTTPAQILVRRPPIYIYALARAAPASCSGLLPLASSIFALAFRVTETV
jgi:hypothetical protein